MKILAIDTATEACSAALAIGATVLARYEEPGRGHAERILPMIDEILAEAGVALTALDAIAFGRGPGAFTGVRIAAAVAQGLAFGAGLPVIPVSSLAALAERGLAQSPADAALACIDARMAEVYWGGFRRTAPSSIEALGDERVTAPGAVMLGEAGSARLRWIGVGTGFGAFPGLAARLGIDTAAVDARLLPRAHEMTRIGMREFAAGRARDPERAVPVYLRDKVVSVP
ncbi:MAG TPA: tRNA (adenosine(37)-N6)-threonylcarbamoyltransferase complex dimerization subunit type 1 TsaB [Steroidobacteraceae bacterium]|nr:tRNA (adenosine(37)-N6)-threonylcarbamoyltransferase complex dimerization subunit type 1 TsaB [Steroidobacteraceae bacterium]